MKYWAEAIGRSIGFENGSSVLIGVAGAGSELRVCQYSSPIGAQGAS